MNPFLSRRESKIGDFNSYTQLVLSQILDYDEERKELKRKLEETRALRISRSVSAACADNVDDALRGSKTPALQRRRSSINPADIWAKARGMAVLSAVMKANALAFGAKSGLNFDELKEDSEDEERETPAEEPKQEEEKERPTVPNLMSSEATEALTALKTAEEEKRALKRMAERFPLVRSNPLRPNSGRGKLKPCRQTSFSLSEEHRPSSGRRPRSGSRPLSGLKKTTSSFDLHDTTETSKYENEDEEILNPLKHSITDTKLVDRSHERTRVTFVGSLLKHANTESEITKLRVPAPPKKPQRKPNKIKSGKRRKKIVGSISLKSETEGRGVFVKYEEVSTSEDENDNTGDGEKKKSADEDSELNTKEQQRDTPSSLSVDYTPNVKFDL